MWSLLQAIAWLGGGAFLASLGYFFYTYAVTLARPAEAGAPVVQAIVVDTLLFVLFAAHHSLFARPWAKRWITAVVPASLERSLFVWAASLLLALVCAAWQPLPGTVYSHSGWIAWLHRSCVAAGLLLTALGARELAPLELAGVDQARRKGRRRSPLVTSFPYSLVRHPIYLGWVLVVFGVPVMTASRLLMACLSTAYLAIAVPWEERLLIREFGGAYREYCRRVRWRMIPWVY
jgi:protein-S-isoprenylcysteine O-methyltransferase Ste14